MLCTSMLTLLFQLLPFNNINYIGGLKYCQVNLQVKFF